MIKTPGKVQSRSELSASSSLKGKKMHLNVHRSVDDQDDDWPKFRVPPSQAQPKAVFTSCHYCGYDPGVIPENGACPKCGGHSWERNAISVRLLPKEAHTLEH